MIELLKDLGIVVGVVAVMLGLWWLSGDPFERGPNATLAAFHTIVFCAGGIVVRRALK